MGPGFINVGLGLGRGDIKITYDKSITITIYLEIMSSLSWFWGHIKTEI